MEMLVIGWCGHACVYIRRENGYTLVIDPHDGLSIGLPKPSVKGDLILVTHDHFDHNAVNVVVKQSSRIMKMFRGYIEVDDITVKGIKTFHDKFGGKRRGENTVYILEVDGYKIAHLGDIGEFPLRKEVQDELENIDLLILPVGGVYTIDPSEAWEIIVGASPRNVMPIHYWVKGLILPLFRIEDFLVHVKGYKVVRLDRNVYDLEEYDKTVIIPMLPAK